MLNKTFIHLWAFQKAIMCSFCLFLPGLKINGNMHIGPDDLHIGLYAWQQHRALNLCKYVNFAKRSWPIRAQWPAFPPWDSNTDSSLHLRKHKGANVCKIWPTLLPTYCTGCCIEHDLYITIERVYRSLCFPHIYILTCGHRVYTECVQGFYCRRSCMLFHLRFSFTGAKYPHIWD